MLKKLSKEKSVPRKKAAAPAKVGGKCKISEDSNSDSSDEEEIVPKKSSVSRKKAPVKVGAKCKLSEDSNSDSFDEEEIVPKKSSHAKV